MKANELQICDWFLYKGEPHQIVDIDRFSVMVESKTTIDSRADFEEIEPIPLTHEILEKNGFKRGFGEEGQPIFSTIQFGEYGMWDGYCFPNCKGRVLQYVHQLQHALKLCGIEKEFVI